MCGWGEGQVCGLKPVLRAWKPLRGWGVWVERGGVRAEALPEGVEAPAGLGHTRAKGMQVKVDPGYIILDLFPALYGQAKRGYRAMDF